jgi:malate permease and related proteins
MMLKALESLVPIVMLMALGAALYRGGFFDETVRRGLDKFTYWVALPSLFVAKLSATDFGQLVAARLALVLVLAVVASAVLAAVLGALIGLGRNRLGVFVQAGFRGNLAFVGLPLIIFALGGPDSSSALVSSALIVLAALVPLDNVISVIALMTANEETGLDQLPKAAVELIKNPLIISALLGAALGLLGWPLPDVIGRPLDLLGQTALALALVSLGGALIALEVGGRLKLSLLAGAFKVAAVPAITYALCVLLELPRDYTLVALIFAACPTATASYIMTTQIGGDDALAAASVVVSTVLSLGALTAVLVLF